MLYSSGIGVDVREMNFKKQFKFRVLFCFVVLCCLLVVFFGFRALKCNVTSKLLHVTASDGLEATLPWLLQ